MRAIRATIAAVMTIGLLLTLAALQGTATAQTYPPPVGSLTVEGAPTTPTVGASTTITATVLDASGNPVSDAEVLFQIESQPGSDAKFANGQTQFTGTTDANGVATAILAVGSTPGAIIVKTVSGEKSSQLTIQARSGAPVPATGGPPPEDGGGLAQWQAALIVAGMAILLGGGVMVIRRRRA